MGEMLNNLEHVYSKWERKRNHNDEAYNSVIKEGKKRWKTRFADLGPPPQRKARYRSKYSQASQDNNLCSTVNFLAHFKTQPSFYPDEGIFRRPMMGRCCSCLPTSRNNLFTDDMPIAGLKNILLVDTHVQNGTFFKYFSHLSFCMQRNCSQFSYPDVSEDVLHCKRLQDAIEKAALQYTSAQNHEASNVETIIPYDTIYKKCERRAARLLKTMKANLSKNLVRFTGWFLFKVFGSLLKSISVHRGQINQLQAATKRYAGIPMVFLPMHRSHLDYTLLTYTLFQYDIQAPHVAAGDNLNIPVFGMLLKGLGGYFIRRKLDRVPHKKDFIYRATLHSYMQELMRAGQYLEFFIEGGRSRSGKACFPKGGLLSVVIDGYLEGVVPDVVMVPINISYERNLDGEFSSEQMGERKKPETFWGAVKAIWKVFMTNYGNVRIDICQPFSLKEYVQVNQFSVQSSSSSPGKSKQSSCGALKPSCSTGSLYGTDIVIEEQRLLVKKLAEHILYSSIHATSIMCTNLVSFVLLTRFRQGTSVSSLVSYVEAMRDELALRNRDVGFSGETTDITCYACDMLEKIGCLKTEKGDKMDLQNNNLDDVMVLPCLELPNVFKLTYYANSVTSAFLMESVIVTAVYAATESYILVTQSQPLTISRNKVLDLAATLCKILQFEFLFVPNCVSLQSALWEAFTQICTSEILVTEDENLELNPVKSVSLRHTILCMDVVIVTVVDSETPEGSRLTHHLSSSLSWSDEDSDDEAPAHDQLYLLNQDSNVNTKFIFLLNILAPYVECYWVAATCLVKLLDSDMEEEVFLKTVHEVALKRVESSIAMFSESASHDMIKTAFRTFQEGKITEKYYIGSTCMISLSDAYNSIEELCEYINLIEQFKL